MTDDTLVINPGAGSFTPGQLAALAYQEYRRSEPLPEGWTHSYGMSSCIVGPSAWRLMPGHTPREQQSIIVCHAESSDYAVELLFLSYPAEANGPSDQSPAGGFQLEFFRKDLAIPTDVETEGVTRLFCGPRFGTIYTLGRDRYRVLDGDPSDRPFPSELLPADPSDASPKPFTRIIHCVLCDVPTDAALQGETTEPLWGFELPIVWKDNTRKAFKADLSLTLKRHLRTLHIVHDWLIACRAGSGPLEGVDQPKREEALKMAKTVEQRYGIRRLELLAGLPPTGSCPADDWASRITHAIARAWGQVIATKWLLRRVTSE